MFPFTCFHPGATWQRICIHIKGDRVPWSEDSGADGDLHDWSCAVELEADSGAPGAYSESGDGDSRAIKRSILESMVHGSEEEWVTPIYPRLATGEQGHDPALGSRSDSGRICGSFCRSCDILHRRPVFGVWPIPTSRGEPRHHYHVDTNRISPNVHTIEYQCIMVVFTLSSLSAQVRAICVNKIKGSCPKWVTI